MSAWLVQQPCTEYRLLCKAAEGYIDMAIGVQKMRDNRSKTHGLSQTRVLRGEEAHYLLGVPWQQQLAVSNDLLSW